MDWAQQNAWRQAMDSISLGVVPSTALLAAAGILIFRGDTPKTE